MMETSIWALISFSFIFTVTLCSFTSEEAPIKDSDALPPFPYMVFVAADSSVCGGVLISAHGIVTPAHCLYSNKDSRWPDTWVETSLVVR